MFSAWAEIKSHKSNAYGWVLSCRVTFNKQIRISYTAKYSFVFVIKCYEYLKL